jgi:hypothetical protein
LDPHHGARRKDYAGETSLEICSTSIDSFREIAFGIHNPQPLL